MSRFWFECGFFKDNRGLISLCSHNKFNVESPISDSFDKLECKLECTGICNTDVLFSFLMKASSLLDVSLELDKT